MADGTQPVRADATNKDYQALRAGMLDLAAEMLPAWTDHSPADLGTLLVELVAYAGDVLAHYQDRIAAESYPQTAIEERSIRHLLRLIGYELAPARAASADLTLLCPVDMPELTVPAGATFTTAGARPVSFRYLGGEQRLNTAGLPLVERAGQTYRRYCPVSVVGTDRFRATLPVRECVARHDDEPAGVSDGSAWQRFALDHRPVDGDSVEVVVDMGRAGAARWQQQPTLLHSAPDERHFTLRYDDQATAWIEFGDGRTGAIPANGSPITASYRSGGGSRGNVAAGAIVVADAGMPGIKVFNESAASGGTDAEAAAEAYARGAGLFRGAGRAVTAADFEEAARSLGVAKAYAHPVGSNRVELFVAPAGGGPPSDALLYDLRRRLDDKRLLTVDVVPRKPRYVPVHLAATWRIEPYRFVADVEQRIQEAVGHVLSFDRVRFGDTLYLSKIYEAIEAVDGVRSVTVNEFRHRDTPGLPAKGRLEFEPDEIPQATYPLPISLAREVTANAE